MSSYSNGTSNSGSTILVLYKVSNSGTDPASDSYNAFHLPRAGGVTLAKVKKHCVALHSMNHLGAEGFHWRVRVDDKPASSSDGSSSKPAPSYSWWDVQDENARLPIKEATTSEIARLFSPKKVKDNHQQDSIQKAGKGAMRALGKAMNAVATSGDGVHESDSGPRVGVVAFKLVDLIKMHDDFGRKNGGKVAAAAPKRVRSAPKRVAPPQPQKTVVPNQGYRASAPPTTSSRQQTAASSVPRVPAPGSTRQSRPTTTRQPQQQRRQPKEPDLMGGLFGSSGANGVSNPSSHRTNSMPNETNAQRKQREYAEAQKTQNRVWDEIDQRWIVTEGTGDAAVKAVQRGESFSTDSPTKTKTTGLSMEASLQNAARKSAHVQASVKARADEMKGAQAKALSEMRERENQKKNDDDAEDTARKQLEPKIKAWSEEHGKKKQLSALLASLHTILWPGAKWKQVSLGDLLNPAKCKKFYHKATLVVHPDKTSGLPPDQRFLAKRIFDALTQAKTEFDSKMN
eukprot:CAMPEP_0198298918 /NCGR_PEP_ID=MMETSP1449-20131203/42652_1 /TAXON_ID=420275 /ORGANISM="Attheya septentrionalis, Strain CCMP2084" /LENGTH=513 /DNA_ID=CAMNT_0044000317 /DNA_START=126 /DNA_END=1667 /DNA_ORIENTATION=-